MTESPPISKHYEAFLKASSAYNNYYAILSMSASMQFLDTYDMIVEETGYYKGRAKQLLNRCKRWLDTYWIRVRTAYGDRYALYFDYANTSAGSLEHDIKIFFYSVKSALDKQKAKDSAVKANILTTAELIRVTATFHEDFWEIAARETGFHDLGKPYWYADYAPLLRMYTEFASLVCSREESTVLDNDMNSRIALRVILSKCEDHKTVGTAAREAISLNAGKYPEYAEMVKVLEEKAEMERVEKEMAEFAERHKDAVDNVSETISPDLIGQLASKYKVTKSKRI